MIPAIWPDWRARRSPEGGKVIYRVGRGHLAVFRQILWDGVCHHDMESIELN